jgi:gas vesicle protein
MGERSDQIRHEIEQTRERMGETVEALGYKANVPRRAKDWIGEKKDALVSSVSERTPEGLVVTERARGLKHTAERNPLGLAIAGAAVGFISGLFAPSTRAEDERLGPVADQVKSDAADAGQEALDRGKEVAQEAAQSAMETAKERGREQGEELSSSLREKH